MISFPNAKINLGLNVIRKREDGYHDIESVLYPVPLQDVLEFREAKVIRFHTSGLEISGNSEDNLCLKAYSLFQEKYDLPPLEIYLHKAIPMGGGLGGGSSDGAFMLSMLNEYFNLDLSTENLESYAAQLGSDCPFFIRNEPAIVRGTGTESKPVSINLNGYSLLFIFPDIHSSTADAYTGISPKIPEMPMESIIDLGLEEWKGNLINDFESSIFTLFPALSKLKDYLYSIGAIYASMTGSGSVLYGIFSDPIDVNPTVKHKWINL